nr:hypothetical protein EC90111_A0082 [Escherichia coli 9.0111]
MNSLDGALTNNEQTASGGVVVATVNKKPLRSFWKQNVVLIFPFRPFPVKEPGVPFSWSAICAEQEKLPVHGKHPRLTNPCWFPSVRRSVPENCQKAGIRSP